MKITLRNISQVPTEYLIGVVANKQVSGGDYFKVIKDMQIVLSDTRIITIPEGFKFDGSSIPKVFRGVLSTYGAFMFGALIHDWLYRNSFDRHEIGFQKARKFADMEMYIWSSVVHSDKWTHRLDNLVRYIAVRAFGKKAYSKYNAKT